MAFTAHRREIVMGSVLVIAAFWLLRPPAAPVLPEEVAAETAKEGDPLDEVRRIPRVDPERLAEGAGEYQGGGRNLFDFGVMRPPPPSPEELAQMAAAEAERQRLEAERQAEAERLRQEALERQREEEAQRAARAAARAAANPPPPPKPVPPSMSFRLIGMVGPADDKLAILLDGEEFLMARVGETVNQSFEVLEIGYDTVTIGYTDPKFASESKVLPLGG